MRTKDNLYNIDNYAILMQYLYLGNTITINNGIANLKIWMEDNYTIKAMNENFKELDPYNYNQEMTLENVLLAIIPYLEKQEPDEFEIFENRWKEIKAITIDNIGLNKLSERI